MLYNEQAASKVAILHNDSTGGGSDMKFKTMLTALVALIAAFTFSGNALAGGNAPKNTCTTNNCYTVPAIPSTTTSTSTSSVSTTHIKEKLTIKEKIRHYEKKTGIIVAVHQKAKFNRAGCVDPIAMGWVKHGGSFRNTRNNGGPYWTTWKAGWKICGARQVKIGNDLYMKGTKMNCGNRDILIPIKLSFKPKVKYSIEVTSLREFSRTYDKWVQKTNSTNTTTTTGTTYSCVQGTLVNGNQCQICPPPTCVPTPPPPGQAPATLVKYVYENGNKVATQSIFGFTKNGSGFTNTGESTNMGSYQIGSSLTVCETNSMGYTANKSCETQTIVAGGNTFFWTNSKTTSTPPPPPVNRPPSGTIKPPQHVYVNGVANVCVDGVSDPDGDQVNVSFSFTAGSAVSAVFTQPGGARCVQYKAPGTPQQVTVTATLSDGRGGTVNLLDNFPVIPDQF